MRTVTEKTVNTIVLIALSITLFGAVSFFFITLLSKSFSKKFNLLIKKMEAVKKCNKIRCRLSYNQKLESGGAAKC